jgi:hypothetical protein
MINAECFPFIGSTLPPEHYFFLLAVLSTAKRLEVTEAIRFITPAWRNRNIDRYSQKMDFLFWHIQRETLRAIAPCGLRNCQHNLTKLGADRHNPTGTDLAHCQKNAGNLGREVNNAIGAGTHDHDTERQYFYVLLEFEIAVERNKYLAYAVRAAQ